MTRIKITGLDKDIKNLKKRVVDSVERSNFDDILARDVAAKVRKDGIQGPPLKRSTIDFRSRVESRKGPNFTAGKSSLTLSGQLLGSLKSVFQKSRAAFFFGVSNGIHKPYRVKRKRVPKSGPNRNKKTYETGGKSQLIDIFTALMRDRPITNVFNDRDFKRKTERKLVAAIKRFFT